MNGPIILVTLAALGGYFFLMSALGRFLARSREIETSAPLVWPPRSPRENGAPSREKIAR